MVQEWNLHLVIQESKIRVWLYLVQDIIFDVRIEILALTSIHLDIHNGLLECEFYTCTWPASNGLQVARYHFCYENWYLGLSNILLDIHNGILELTCIYLASLQDQPPAASRWPDIIFDARIEILTLPNLLLGIHDGISGDNLYICYWPASRISLQRPPGGQILFLMQDFKSWS